MSRRLSDTQLYMLKVGIRRPVNIEDAHQARTCKSLQLKGYVETVPSPLAGMGYAAVVTPSGREAIHWN